MRATLDLPDELIEQAMSLSGAKTKTLAVCLALQEFVRLKKMKKLDEFRGKIDLNLDVRETRDEWEKE